MKSLLLALGAIVLFALSASAQPVGDIQGITVVDSGTACVTAPTACATYTLGPDTGGLALSIGGTWTGTLTFEATANGNLWTAILATNLATGAQATTATVSGLYSITNAGVIRVRARATAAVTGMAIVSAAKGIGFARSWTTGGTITAGGAGGSFYAADGTSSLPAYSFTSEPTLGWYRSGAATMKLAGGGLVVTNGLQLGSAWGINFSNGWLIPSGTTGQFNFGNAGNTLGSQLKVDALPTVASGFGASPAVIAGSTPLAGAVNVGTGGAATTGVITFGGTAFPSAPFCTYSTTTTNATTRGLPTTTQLTLNSTTAWLASDIVSWICISSK